MICIQVDCGDWTYNLFSQQNQGKDDQQQWLFNSRVPH
jgi:hypothetical protein